MTLDILICTIDEGIIKVPDVLMSPMKDIRYVVSMQYTNEAFLNTIPEILKTREDVTLTFIEGRGLSRNRNNAIKASSADILLIADDDDRYTPYYIKTILDTYEEQVYADIICFAAESYEGIPMKVYPSGTMSYQQAFKQGYYASSIEMTMRKGLGLTFDERFGLGSKYLCAGEEEVFMKDALDAGYTTLFVPKVIVSSNFDTTGCHFLENKKIQITKGATFRYMFGVRCAIWHCIREAGYHFFHSFANPFSILHNMLKGIWILQ